MPSNDTILDEVWRSRHRIILILLAAHPPVLFGLGLYHGTDPVTGARIPAFSLPDVLFGMRIAAGFGLLVLVPQLGRRLRTGLASIGSLTVSAVLVYFSEGTSRRTSTSSSWASSTWPFITDASE